MKNRTMIFGMISLLLLLSGCNTLPVATSLGTSSSIQQKENLPRDAAADLTIHFIDVGQGDAILIKTPDEEYMLIDGGGNNAERAILSYLKSQQIKKLKVLVGTHPHEDHIGSLDAVINTFPVENVYLPRVTHNTNSYRNLLLAIQKQGLQIKTARAGVSLPLSGLTCEIISPTADQYDKLNDYSAVIRLQYDDQIFLFCADAGSDIEKSLLNSNILLKSDFIKIGHHGSRYSSNDLFLRAVSPGYAIISCGQDNPYGYPHQETLQRLKEADIECWRTDQSGNIVITADGQQKLDIQAERMVGAE